MSTFTDFWGFNEFLLEMFTTLNEEDLYRYYLHKSIMSDMSYKEFKENVEANINSGTKSEEEILTDVKDIIDSLNQGVKNEVVDEKVQ